MQTLKLHDIQFPIYPIKSNYHKIWEDHNITWIETDTGKYVLDNKNLDGDTLGKRRLKINNLMLYRPRGVFTSVAQLVKCRSKTYIDTTGKVFHYKKSSYVPLKYYKIKEVIPTDEGCILVTEKSSVRLNCREAYRYNYVGFLETTDGDILYEFTDHYKKNSRRKI